MEMKVNALNNRAVYACVKRVPNEAADVFMCDLACSICLLFAYASYRSVLMGNLRHPEPYLLNHEGRDLVS